MEKKQTNKKDGVRDAYHDADTGAEGLALLHAVRGQDDGPAFLQHRQQSLPQEATSPDVHAWIGQRAVSNTLNTRSGAEFQT